MERRRFLKGLPAVPAASLVAIDLVASDLVEPGPEDYFDVDEPLFSSIDLTRVPSEPFDTVIQPRNPAYYRTGDVIHVPYTGENMVVTYADANDRFVTVVRGFGSKPAPLRLDEPLWFLGLNTSEG